MPRPAGTRREERAYSQYVSDEQRSSGGMHRRSNAAGVSPRTPRPLWIHPVVRAPLLRDHDGHILRRREPAVVCQAPQDVGAGPAERRPNFPFAVRWEWRNRPTGCPGRVRALPGVLPCPELFRCWAWPWAMPTTSTPTERTRTQPRPDFRRQRRRPVMCMLVPTARRHSRSGAPVRRSGSPRRYRPF